MQPFLSKNIALIIGALAVLLVAGFLFFVVKPISVEPTGDVNAITTTATSTATSTATAPSAPPKKQPLPPEPIFVMPEGGKAIDDYVFVDDGVVYFKSLVSTSTHLKVPSADPATFHPIQGFSTYPGQDVVRDCGAAPVYTFYIDKLRPYLYQIWRAPEFRTGQVDAMNGANPKKFLVTGLTTATDGRFNFQIGYKKATSTCILILNQTRI